MSFLQKIKSSFGKPQDAQRINQEMYKKSAELNEKNKTLSLLQKLNAIVLGSITRLNDIAQLVTYLLVTEAGFENVAIFLHSKKDKTLQRIALSETEKSTPLPYFSTLLLTQNENLIVQSANEKIKKQSTNLENILLSSSDSRKPDAQQFLSSIKSVYVFPLVVRNELLGSLVISLSDDEQAISEYRRDLLDRLADTIGIGLDNALLYNEVQETNKKLVKLDQLKDEFVSVASHELRTPMTAIKSYLWMTLDGRGGEISEKQKFYLNRAYGSVDRLIRLVNDMLNVSRIDSGRIVLDLKDVKMDILTQEVLDEVMPRAQELGLSIQINSSQALPKVIADTDKAKEVLFNLIGNSMKFTPKGGSITVSFVQKDNFVQTTVADTGTGIEKEDITKLFEKFSMVEGSFASDKSIQGTGLGLYICKSIVELHGGKIWATSEGRDKGTQFTFSLKVYHEGDLPKAPETLASDKQTVGIIHTKI